MLKAGDFFIGPFPPGSGKKRRFLVLTDELSGQCTVVWVFTSTNMTDSSCVIKVNEHPLITQDCSIICKEASIADANDIRFAVANGALTALSPLNGEIVKRAFEALFVSLETPDEILDYCAELD